MQKIAVSDENIFAILYLVYSVPEMRGLVCALNRLYFLLEVSISLW